MSIFYLGKVTLDEFDESESVKVGLSIKGSGFRICLYLIYNHF